MIIQIMRRLLDEMNLSCRWLSHIGKKEYPQGLYDWYAAAVEIKGRTVIVLVNNLTRYPVVLLWNDSIQPADFMEYILEALREEGIHEDVLTCFRRQAGVVFVDRASDPELIQKAHYICKEIKRQGSLLDEGACLQAKLGREAARVRVHYPNAGYQSASDYLFQMLGRMKTDAGLACPLFDLEGLDLMIRLEIPQTVIESRVRVPSNIMFGLLHKMIIKLFDWNENGEHVFLCGEKMVDDICELKAVDWCNGIRYDFWMPGHHRWEHTICLKGRIRYHQRVNAAATERRGNRPPWKIDGPGAYEKYQKSLSDYNDPDHEAAQRIQEECGPGMFSLREINKELRWVMMR